MASRFRDRPQIGNIISPAPPNTNISEKVDETGVDGQRKTTTKFFDDNLLIADLLKGSTNAPEVSVGNLKQPPMQFDNQDQAQPEAQPEGGGFLNKLGRGVGKIGDYLASDPGQDILGKIGQAFTASDPSSPAFQLNRAISERAQGNIKSGLLGKALEGSLTAEDLKGADPAAVQEAIQTQTRLGETASQERLRAAQITGVETPTQRREREIAVAQARPGPTPGTIMINKKLDPVSGKVVDTPPGEFHIWRKNATGAITFSPDAYIGRHEGRLPEGGAGSDPQVQNRLWYNQAVKEAMNSPEVQKFGQLITDSQGNTTIQFHDPVNGRIALNQQIQLRIDSFIGQKLLPEGFTELTPSKPKFEF